MWDYLLECILDVLQLAFEFIVAVVTYPLNWAITEMGADLDIPTWVLRMWNVVLRAVDTVMSPSLFGVCMKIVVTVLLYHFALRVIWWCVANLIVPGLATMKDWLGGFVSWILD